MKITANKKDEKKEIGFPKIENVVIVNPFYSSSICAVIMEECHSILTGSITLENGEDNT